MTTPSDPQALKRQLARCQKTCEEAIGTIDNLSERRSTFLMRNLDDALNQLELILRVLSDREPDRSSQEAKSFLRRITIGLSKRERDEEETDDGELPALDLSQQGLEGNTWTIPISELIGFLAFGRKTGVLWVDSPEENYLIGLHEGNLMHATSDRTPEGMRLGEILVGLGYLTRRQLERFLSTLDGDADHAGEALLESGLISNEELQEALSQQVQQLFHRLVQTKNAVFHFREGMQVMLAYQVELNTTQLLLETARVQDEREAHEAQPQSQEWDSWNHDVLSELSKLADVLPKEEVETSAKVDATTSKPGTDAKAQPEPALPNSKASEASEASGAKDEKPASVLESDSKSGDAEHSKGKSEPHKGKGK